MNAEQKKCIKSLIRSMQANEREIKRSRKHVTSAKIGIQHDRLLVKVQERIKVLKEWIK